jgi:hypothetical protein
MERSSEVSVPCGGDVVDGDELVFALVAFDGPDQAAVARVVTPFASPREADSYARSEGLDRYAVGPVYFPVRSLTVPPQRS